jgi:hypothetical protein
MRTGDVGRGRVACRTAGLGWSARSHFVGDLPLDVGFGQPDTSGLEGMLELLDFGALGLEVALLR